MAMSDPFVHLHVHSEYSMLDGFGHPEDFVLRAKELGQTALAVTDHGNVSAHKKWYDCCLEHGIKPLLGVEAYVVENSLTKASAKPWHITLLARNLTGYRNMMRLVTHSYERGFYYKPRIDWDILRDCREGIIATSGCPSGRVGRGITKEGWDLSAVKTEILRQKELFETYYLEVSPWDYEAGRAVAEMVYKTAVSEDLPLVLTMDAHYPRPENARIQDVMLCIQQKARYNDPRRMKFSQQDFCLWSGDEMASKWVKIHGARLPGLDEMITNTRAIADSVEFQFPQSSLLEFPFDGDKQELLWRLCCEGMNRLGFQDKAAYKDRLQYEFDLVVSKKFIDYFLIVQDIVVWAKENGILVGAARGSSCGSLMCYLLRITEIDPLVHGLMVERFVDVSRKDLPDIDIDFEAERRNEVKNYVLGKYGHDRVASLAIFSTFKGKSCLLDIGRTFPETVPLQAVEEVKRLVIERSGADSRFGATIRDTFTNFEQAAVWLKRCPELGLACEIEGQVRQLGVHAAGVIVSQEPITNFAAIYKSSSGERVISMDYEDATSVGLLKIDMLGLTVLTIAKQALASIKTNHGVEVDLMKIPLDDPKVYKSFCDDLLQGIFQFEGQSTRQVCRQVKPDTFDQLVAVNALSRPGPLHSGGTTNYVERREGKQKADPLHPMLAEITARTYGITIYQEQVMQIVRLMGRFDWSGIATVRKMMSKKWGEEAFAKMRDQFVAGATSQGVKSEDALSVWQNICTFGSWAFNMSHSVAYSMMAYQMMWLKTHYPAEFYAAAINCNEDDDDQRRLLKEYARTFGRPLGICINRSGVKTTATREGLRIGLESVSGLTEKMRDEIVRKRPYRSYTDFVDRCKISPAKTEILARVGAFHAVEHSRLGRQTDMFGADLATNLSFDMARPSDEDLAAHCPSLSTNRRCEAIRSKLEKTSAGRVYKISELESINCKTEVLIVGTTNIKAFNAKNKIEETYSRGQEWVPKRGEESFTKDQFDFLNFEVTDETDFIISRIGYKQYPRYKQAMWAIKPHEVLGIRGWVMGNGMRMVFASEIINLTAMDARIAAGGKMLPEERDFLTCSRKRWH